MDACSFTSFRVRITKARVERWNAASPSIRGSVQLICIHCGLTTRLYLGGVVHVPARDACPSLALNVYVFVSFVKVYKRACVFLCVSAWRVYSFVCFCTCVCVCACACV